MTETECLENKLCETQCELEKALERADLQFKAHTAQYNLHCETKAELEKAHKRISELEESDNENIKDILFLEDALIGRNDVDPATGGMLDRKAKLKERIRDLIATEGEVGDLRTENESIRNSRDGYELALKQIPHLRKQLEQWQAVADELYRQGKAAHDQMVTWFSSEYAEHPKAKALEQALARYSALTPGAAKV